VKVQNSISLGEKLSCVIELSPELFHEKWNTSDSQEKKSEMELTIPNQKSEIGIPGLQKGKILYSQT
jgi:hypothetical protein